MEFELEMQTLVENEATQPRDLRSAQLYSTLLSSPLPSQFLGFDLARFRLASGWRLRTAFKSGRA